MTVSLSKRAMTYAYNKHLGHLRKYTHCEYFTHLAEVAQIAGTVLDDEVHLAVAWLHDVVEDRGETYESLLVEFGEAVADGVMLMSDMEEGNRAQRKAQARDRLGASPGWIQTIKCADLISNTPSIAQYDPRFFVTYKKEALLLLDVLDKADPAIREQAINIINRE